MEPWCLVFPFFLLYLLSFCNYMKTFIYLHQQKSYVLCIITFSPFWGYWGIIWQVEEIHFVGFLSKLLETKMTQVLRFELGQVHMCFRLSASFFSSLIWNTNYDAITFVHQIYSVGVSVFLGGNKPSRTGDVRGDISINFSCDPEISSKLVKLLSVDIIK